MLLIGSNPLKKLGVTSRIPKDFDWIATQSEYEQYINDHSSSIVKIDEKKYGFVVHLNNHKPVEFEIAEKRPSALLLLKLYEHKCVDLDLLYTLKMSHRYLKDSPHFLKTRSDILAMRKAGAKIPNELREFYKIRQDETYWYKHPKLNQSKTDFFSDKFYVYDHDTLHLAVMIGAKPAYDNFKFDAADVLCSKEKFLASPEEIKLASVYEESCVLALERHQIPNDFRPDRTKSFSIALQKVCTSITSGWWREYAWENYDRVLALYHSVKPNYIERFHIAKLKGILAPHQPKVTNEN